MSPARAQVELKAQCIGCSGFAMASHFSRDSNGRQPGNLRFQHRNKLARSEPSSPQSTINTTALDYKTVEICPKKYLFFSAAYIAWMCTTGQCRRIMSASGLCKPRLR